MNDLGFFCINRKIFEHEIFQDAEKFRAWIDLIGHFARGTDNCTLKRSQFQVSERELAKRWKWSQAAVHRFLEYLRSEKMIETLTPSAGESAPVYRVTNYEKYNFQAKRRNESPGESPSESPKPQKPQPDSGNRESPSESLNESLISAYKEETKIKQCLNKDSLNTVGILKNAFEGLWGKYPVKDGRKAAERHFFATVKTPTDIPRIEMALAHYLQHLEITGYTPKNGSTWFNNWTDFENWIQPQGIAYGKRDTPADQSIAAAQRLRTRFNQQDRSRAQRELIGIDAIGLFGIADPSET